MNDTTDAMTGGGLSMRGLEQGRHAGPRILAVTCGFVLLATACTSPTVTTTTSTTVTTTTSATVTTQPATGTLIVHSGTVELNGLAVPPGEEVPVKAGDRVRATNDGLATLRQRQLSLELFKQSDLRVPDTTKSPVVIPLQSGHVQVSVSPGAGRVQLQTADRTLAVEGTSFVVCQAGTGTTCLFVIEGSVDWSDPRGDMRYNAGEGTFATAEQGPQAARCDVDDTVEQWLAQALDGEQNEPLTATVDTLSEGSCAEAGLPSAEGMAHVAIEDPEIGTDKSADQPDVYRERALIDGPIVFYVDKQAVSNGDFRSWVVVVAQNDAEEWKRLVPISWLDGFEGVETQATYPPGEEDFTVIGVRWEAGADYCRSLSKHLVTEIEWELAAVNDYLLDLEAERQDWVAEPGEYGDERPDGQRMKRGNNDSFQIDPYYRLSVVDTAESTATRSGVRIRCAASEVQGGDADLANVEFADDFTSLANAWPGDEDELFALNYHGPDTYHLESRQQHTRGAVIRDTSGTLEDAVVNAEVFIVRDRMGEVAGNYRFGVTAGSPETGFLLFTVQPDEASLGRHDWCLSMMSDRLATMLADADADAAWYRASSPPEDHEGEFCPNGLDSGFIDVADIDDPLRMTIKVSADDVVVALNGREEGTADLAIPVDAFGFFTQTYAKNKAHIHFDEVSVTVP